MSEIKKSRYTQAQNKATQKYIKANYDEIKIRLPKGKKEIIKNYAIKHNESVNSLIKRIIDEAMERDKGKDSWL